MKKLSRAALTLILAILLAAGPAMNCAAITIAEEEDLARNVLKVIKERFPLVEDPLVTGYVEKVGRRILSTMPPQPFHYEFYVIDNEAYNAFATPAGHIFVHTGLIAAMDSDLELAGILAHEIAHVASRHISQKIERSKKVQIGTLAGMVAGALLGVGGAAAAANAVSMGSAAAAASYTLSHSRQDETQADQLGLIYLEKAGFSAEGLSVILKKIRDKQWFGSTEVPAYLSTHPAVEARIAYVTSWIDTHRSEMPKGSPLDPWEFERVRIRLATRYGEEQKNLAAFADAVKQHPDSPAAHYGLALMMGRTGQWDEAVAEMKKALQYRAFDAFLLNDLGKIYFESGQYDKAVRTLEGAATVGPFVPESRLLLGRSLAGMGQLDEARAVLSDLVAKQGDYSEGHYFLSELYGKKDMLDRAHFELGVFNEQTRRFDKAAHHFERAATLTSDPELKAEAEKREKASRDRYYRIRRENEQKEDRKRSGFRGLMSVQP